MENEHVEVDDPELLENEHAKEEDPETLENEHVEEEDPELLEYEHIKELDHLITSYRRIQTASSSMARREAGKYQLKGLELELTRRRETDKRFAPTLHRENLKV